MDLRQDKAELENKINNLLNEFQHKHDVVIDDIHPAAVGAGLDSVFSSRVRRTVVISIDLDSKGNDNYWNRR